MWESVGHVGTQGISEWWLICSDVGHGVCVRTKPSGLSPGSFQACYFVKSQMPLGVPSLALGRTSGQCWTGQLSLSPAGVDGSCAG